MTAGPGHVRHRLAGRDVRVAARGRPDDVEVGVEDLAGDVRGDRGAADQAGTLGADLTRCDGDQRDVAGVRVASPSAQPPPAPEKNTTAELPSATEVADRVAFGSTTRY